MKKKLKLAFSDFWGGFEYNPNSNTPVGDNVFYNILSERFDIEISNNPDFLIFSVFGNNHQRYSCKKIFYTGENIRPNFEFCDYSISFDYIEDDRNIRYPLSGITLYESNKKYLFERETDLEKIKNSKNKFCNFIFSNANANLRNTLMSELSKYKKVDSGGRALNNIGYLVGDKLEFISEYKFTIAFENSEYPGYTTEKIVHPKLVESIPLYWGNPVVNRDWNTKSFINMYDFTSLKEFVEYIIEVDNNDDLYFNILKESHFNNPKSKDLDHRSILDFFDKINP
jgi:hypothetical protein